MPRRHTRGEADPTLPSAPARLPGALERELAAWLASVRARYVPPLTERELNRGVRALSSLYVERRSAGPLAPRATEGLAKRAAFACYYAALHFLTVYLALDELGTTWLAGTRRVFDLGAGSGAAGAALARSLPTRPQLLAIERSGWALEEAARTYAAFGVRARLRRGQLPRALPRVAAGDVLACGWFVNECEEDARRLLLEAIEAGVRRGARLWLVEPLAGGVAPWWRGWARRLETTGIREHTLRVRVALPEPVERLDRATGLRHDELGARVLWGPPAPEGRGGAA